MFYSVPISATSQLQLTFTFKGDTIHLHLGAQWGNSPLLSSDIVFAGNALTTASFFQLHNYGITLMTSSFEEIHITHLLRT